MASGEQSGAPCSAPAGPPGPFTRLLAGHQCDYEEKREECESHHTPRAALEIEEVFNSQERGSADVGSNQAQQNGSATQAAIVSAEERPDPSSNLGLRPEADQSEDPKGATNKRQPKSRVVKQPRKRQRNLALALECIAVPNDNSTAASEEVQLNFEDAPAATYFSGPLQNDD
ncbi:unnamed protein product [Phytophthora fragariaefolia]|uniref:Unnamed protein product n=1 Tax=Phytophthora fragariaefolia TaxID=1490495 RepID=A0A9W6XUV6_9STRA|nr:unnamed protein product [Phytophthora fragariaefolia]